jgi:hypothetical protein
MIGWYSEEADERIGHCLYLNTNNEEVKVTEVTDDETSTSEWDDKINVGEVVKYVRSYNKSFFGSY